MSSQLFTETKRVLTEMLENKIFGDYAVLINFRGKETLLTSENVDEYTYFDVASMGKVLITSTLILRAVGEGRLSLDASLPEFFNDVREEMSSVTVRQLLTHTSGIVRFEFPDEARGFDRERLAKLILDHPLGYAPGCNSRYSCNGFILLGIIAEKVWGEPLEKLFDKFIRSPLCLARSQFTISVDEANAVISYSRRNAESVRYDDHNVRIMNRAAGSGGQFWCVRDIDTYLRSVIEKDGRLYAPELFDIAEKNYTQNFSEGRGLGWLVVDERYPQTGKLFPIGSFGHCGHTGMSMFVNREQELRVIIATNATRFANMKNDFRGYDYSHTMKMRENLHNAIYLDLYE